MRFTATVIAASCNVNDAFQRGDRLFVVRRGAGANIPLPQRAGSARTVQNEEMCPGGSIVTSLAMTELTATHVRLLYREESRDCMRFTSSIASSGVAQEVECECAAR